MTAWQGLLFLVAVALLVWAAVSAVARPSVFALAAAFAVLAFGLPDIAALWAALTP